MLNALSRLSGMKIGFYRSELSQILTNLSQNSDVPAKRYLCLLPLRLLEMSFPGAACHFL